MSKSFLLFDDKLPQYYFAKRNEHEIKEEFHNMEIGEVRMLSENIGIERED
jgi:hypothetical protein